MKHNNKQIIHNFAIARQDETQPRGSEPSLELESVMFCQKGKNEERIYDLGDTICDPDGYKFIITELADCGNSIPDQLGRPTHAYTLRYLKENKTFTENSAG